MPHNLEDAAFWSQPVELVMPLWIAMSLHGYASLLHVAVHLWPCLAR